MRRLRARAASEGCEQGLRARAAVGIGAAHHHACSRSETRDQRGGACGADGSDGCSDLILRSSFAAVG